MTCSRRCTRWACPPGPVLARATFDRLESAIVDPAGAWGEDGAERDAVGAEDGLEPPD